MNLESKIEAILFFKNEPVTLTELSKVLKVPREKLQITIDKLQREFGDRGIVLVTNGDEVSLGTHPEVSELIENMQKEELSRDLGRAGLETLAIVLYRGPVTRRDIDNIRGLNSGFTLRALLVRGLIERAESDGRSHVYKPTIKLLQYLGKTRREELPEFETAFKKIAEFESRNNSNSTNGNE
ncbi:MAG: SMC-Scp complex subunit ScpB [Candidatus Zambryskibacteria bacterium RIFCSPHIGHO2_01_FULL_44_22b]|uniref:SMC-Scp complex subunit ScpB n=1 Tax=Candidatus Zambryskibacteria bacterium RIFCSPHIGHO2_01_FULL_44_22b TaxID=1802737 RepID=A0A1G2SXT1_9BACT|nr:MAG: SMC-Scp complex subunit ScpB [Candidatus Zambryskibacteria bacterium RIFCSPHIGHO2_01_FULL_44_22b]